MTRRKTATIDVGADLIEGMGNVLAYASGETQPARVTRVVVPDAVDVAAIRKNLKLSQDAFASKFGFSVKNIRNWEQGAREPEGAARAYLTVIERNPEAVEQALQVRRA